MQSYLLLENGTVFCGSAFGAVRETTAEIVFTTQMTGYLETLTDPSYFGQAVVQTFPLIGNYGVIPSDFESRGCFLSAYIVRDWCQTPSNFRCEGDLDTFLKEKNIPGLYGIDTRALTKMIRSSGTMNGMILYEDPTERKEELIAKLKEYSVKNAVSSVTVPKKTEYIHKEDKSAKTVVLYDFGAKENIARSLFNLGLNVLRVPADTSASKVLALKPDGIMLSNGPGDPAENVSIIKELKMLLESQIPIFGICLGHQLLALAAGAKSYKLKFGHRGANQPVKDENTGKIYITSQNHGYAIDENTLPKTAKAFMKNANDNSVEGIEYENAPAFSVQFHPEACAGPLDTSFLFNRFLENINSK